MINLHTTGRKQRWTDKELESPPEDGYKYELLDGSLIKSLGGPRHGKFLLGAPDLAVEVLSPSERLHQVHRKLDRFFEHGVRLV